MRVSKEECREVAYWLTERHEGAKYQTVKRAGALLNGSKVDENVSKWMKVMEVMMRAVNEL